MSDRPIPSRGSASPLVVTVAVASLVLCSSAAGAQPALDDYNVTSWTIDDGLPSNVIWTIAQDRDGYLWLGTNGGLVRFDGVRFVVPDTIPSGSLPSAPVRSLYTARDGSLWIGFSEAGGVSRLLNGRVRNYGEQEGLARGSVLTLIEDHRGTIWAGTRFGLFRLEQDRWQKIGAEQGLPDTGIARLFRDRRDRLYVSTFAGIFRRLDEPEGFEVVDDCHDVELRFRGYSEDPSNAIWVTDPATGFRRLGECKPTRVVHKGRGSQLLHDRHGHLWAAVDDELWRVREAAPQPTVIEETKIAGIRSMLEDREGNIWLATGNGLIRLTEPRVTPITHLGRSESVDATSDGSVWAATAEGLFRFTRPAGGWRATRTSMPGDTPTIVRADTAGTLWVPTSSGLVRLRGGQPAVRRFGTGRSLRRIHAIAADGRGSVWISDRNQGLFRWDDERGLVEPLAQLGRTRIRSINAESTGRLWFATDSGRLGVIGPDHTVQTYGPEDGLGTGPYYSIYEDSQQLLWIGGTDGLSQRVGTRFVKIGQANGFHGSVFAIVEDLDGDLWLGTGSGIAWLARVELEKAARLPSYHVRSTLLDSSDGLAGLPVSVGSGNAARATDGTLWFVTARGITMVDPRALKQRAVSASVRIERALVDDRVVSVETHASLPPRTSRLQIEYTSLTLGAPHKTRFRYRLEGFDAEWTEAGTERHASYARLPAGDYRFRVATGASDGSWEGQEASWQFTVRPLFYQTAWFVGACAGVTVLLTWTAWQLRVRRIRRQFGLLLGERVRLSREIHDTLLQSLVGVTLQFDALSKSVDSPEAKQQVVRIRKQVQEYIREARHTIWNLRSPMVETGDLATAIREAASRATFGTAVQLQFSLIGAPFPCHHMAEEQLIRIVQEAVVNAVRHAHARRVTVALEYGEESVTVRVSDDGCGFDPARIGLETTGHYGLTSMRERTEQVDGRFSVSSTINAGTTIQAVLQRSAVQPG